MIVLGITDGITCGAAVVRDGKILAAVNEERLIRKKMAHGFPAQSIREVLKLCGMDAADVDAVAVATRNNYFSYECKACLKPNKTARYEVRFLRSRHLSAAWRAISRFSRSYTIRLGSPSFSIAARKSAMC
jgi:predicted NodU family carbamoyl transferase